MKIIFPPAKYPGSKQVIKVLQNLEIVLVVIRLAESVFAANDYKKNFGNGRYYFKQQIRI